MSRLNKLQDVASRPRIHPLRIDASPRVDMAAFRRVGSPLAFVLLWQLGSMTGWIPANKLAAPSAILAAFWTLAASGDLLRHLTVSLTRVSVGLLIGVALGVQLAFRRPVAHR